MGDSPAPIRPRLTTTVLFLLGIPNAKGYHHETIVSVQVEYYMLTVLSI